VENVLIVTLVIYSMCGIKNDTTVFFFLSQINYINFRIKTNIIKGENYTKLS
jgi:hypothetical protein